jgi:50S ribosomal subunit-associated GTPase HflX
MIQMELPHLTVLTKVDLLEDQSILDKLDELDPKTLVSEINPMMGKNMEKLSSALVNLVI